MRARVLVLLLGSLAIAGSAQAQSRGDALGFRGFGDVGGEAFTAADSFTAIIGSASGLVFGGGADVVLPQRIFIGVRASRFQKTGERVFVADGETFPLGIEDTVTITPIEVTGGYRFARAAAALVPYAGGGIGWHRLRETSEFAADDENVDETHTGFHVLGGAEFRLTRWIAAAGEVQWTTVRDALGQDPNSVSAAFDETDLGGTTFRVKIIIGR